VEQAKSKEQIAEALSSFQTISRKEITCIQCTHTGVQGQVSGNFFNWMTLLGLAVLIVGNFADQIGWIAWLLSPVMIVMGVWKSNKFKCPSCGLESNPGCASKTNPLYKKQ